MVFFCRYPGCLPLAELHYYMWEMGDSYLNEFVLEWNVGILIAYQPVSSLNS